jgi:hypothetical protein
VGSPGNLSLAGKELDRLTRSIGNYPTTFTRLHLEARCLTAQLRPEPIAIYQHPSIAQDLNHERRSAQSVLQHDYIEWNVDVPA